MFIDQMLFFSIPYESRTNTVKNIAYLSRPITDSLVNKACRWLVETSKKCFFTMNILDAYGISAVGISKLT